MERLLLGDNQFFGVNHMSEEKARAQAMRFQSTAEIIKVLDCAYAEGIRAFMCTTHDRIQEVCDHVRANAKQYPGFVFYPCMPYAHKYANAVTEHGILNAVSRMLPSEGAFGAMLKGGVSLAKRDITGIGELLIDAEMKMFQGLDTPVIFLQNVVTDLILGMGMPETFRIFADYARRKYNAEPGFITMNMPMLLDALDGIGINNPIVCCNLNKIGFRMSGGIDLYEKVIDSRRVRVVAMSVLASGALPPREALEYVASLKKVEAVVFGASSQSNIRETKQLFDELFGANTYA